MQLISHRGNLVGPNKELENNFEYILAAIDQGFDVEVDIRYINSEWWLGHDGPQYQIESPFTIFDNSKIWWHCKNFEALEEFQNSSSNYFWHQTDDHTLTSKGYIWTFPGKEIGSKNIVVMPETVMPIDKIKDIKAFAICSDYVALL